MSGVPILRPALDDDRATILRLGVRALGWTGDDSDRDFLAWKHDQNPFGSSPAWVAVLDDRVISFRTFLRWEVREPSGETLRLVRAVDTATDPDHQRQGLFRRLTLAGVEALAAEGVHAIFNTPNERSRPGYLEMGWSELGRPRLGVHPSGLMATARVARRRPPAGKWSEPCTVGVPASAMLADPAMAGLLGGLAAPRGWSTPLTTTYLQWRYGFEPLHYRAIDVRDGIAIFRVRTRGRSREVALCEWLAPAPDPRAVRALVRAVGDYAIAAGPGLRKGMIPIPRAGPVVTWRPLARAQVPHLRDLSFGIGDLELF